MRQAARCQAGRAGPRARAAAGLAVPTAAAQGSGEGALRPLRCPPCPGPCLHGGRKGYAHSARTAGGGAAPGWRAQRRSVPMCSALSVRSGVRAAVRPRAGGGGQPAKPLTPVPRAPGAPARPRPEACAGARRAPRRRLAHWPQPGRGAGGGGGGSTACRRRSSPQAPRAGRRPPARRWRHRGWPACGVRCAAAAARPLEFGGRPPHSRGARRRAPKAAARALHRPPCQLVVLAHACALNILPA